MIITRGLSEMTRIGSAYGGVATDIPGLGGRWDLFLTCSSSNSRNYTVGYRLGQGEKLDVIMSYAWQRGGGCAYHEGRKTDHRRAGNSRTNRRCGKSIRLPAVGID